MGKIKNYQEQISDARLMFAKEIVESYFFFVMHSRLFVKMISQI